MAEEMKNQSEATQEKAVKASKPKKNAETKAKKPSALGSFFRAIGRLFVRLGRFLKDCKSEMKKVVWYSEEATLKNSLVVLIVMVVVGALVCALDFGLFEGIKKLGEIL